MNKVYQVVWSKARNCYVVVSELAKRSGKCSSGGSKKVLMGGRSGYEQYIYFGYD